jgi:hypothetical protein
LPQTIAHRGAALPASNRPEAMPAAADVFSCELPQASKKRSLRARKGVSFTGPVSPHNGDLGAEDSQEEVNDQSHEA